jgi:hypothetical protein
MLHPEAVVMAIIAIGRSRRRMSMFSRPLRQPSRHSGAAKADLSEIVFAAKQVEI